MTIQYKEHMKQLSIILLMMIGILQAQLSVTSVQRLPIPAIEQWSNAQFSPDGRSIFLTNADMNGIWEYSPATNLLRTITDAPRSGYGFTISSDGSTIGYRTTIREANGTEPRIQSAVTVDLRTLEKRTIETNNAVEIPAFVSNKAVFRKSISSAASSSVPVLIGTDDDGIVLAKDGKTFTVDPFKGGRYIWPALSPDRTKLTAVEMSRGAFLCDVNGLNPVRLGKCNSPQWTPDGKWIIGMNDTDDGHTITGSEIIAFSADGSKRISLTETKDVIELFPSVHPFRSEIITTTATGELLLLKYTEGK
jgi:Tol biopolymer transport system component